MELIQLARPPSPPHRAVKDGEITERGTFDELMARGGDFAEIYERQLAEVGA